MTNVCNVKYKVEKNQINTSEHKAANNDFRSCYENATTIKKKNLYF